MSPRPDPADPAPLLPLAGVRILDLSQYLPGPAAMLMLAQLGAQVVKIEPPQGDPARHMGERRRRSSQVFVALQRGKNLLTLDLKQPEDKARLLQMAGEADALVEGFRPGVMERLGLGWETLRAGNPRLVLCSISGYGQQGLHRQRAGHDINYLGYAGVLDQSIDREGRPVLSGLPVADLMGGAQTAVIGLLAALLAARQTGRGSHVDVSMTSAMFASNILAAAAANVSSANASGDGASNAQVSTADAPGKGLLTGGAPCYNVYRTADARFMAVGALEHRYWAETCEVLQRPDLAGKHWSLGQSPGSPEALEVRAELDRIFSGKTLAQWVEIFDAHDCCVTPVLTMREAMRHPMFVDDGMVQTHVDAEEGESRFPSVPVRFRE